MSDSSYCNSKPLRRETRSCSVPSCKNKRVGKKDGTGPSFHKFPKDPNLRRIWIDQCRIRDKFIPDSASICSEHFEFEDFERSYQKQLMGIEIRPMLRKDVIPRLNLPPLSTENVKFKNGIRVKFHELLNSSDSASDKVDEDDVEVEMKTIDLMQKNDSSTATAFILDDESNIESYCVPSIEVATDPLSNSIENIQTDPDYKNLYFQILEKYEKLKTEMIKVENDLVKEKKRVNDYQDILTHIFSHGEVHLVHEKKKVNS